MMKRKNGTGRRNKKRSKVNKLLGCCSQDEKCRGCRCYCTDILLQMKDEHCYYFFVSASVSVLSCACLLQQFLHSVIYILKNVTTYAPSHILLQLLLA